MTGGADMKRLSIALSVAESHPELQNVCDYQLKRVNAQLRCCSLFVNLMAHPLQMLDLHHRICSVLQRWETIDLVEDSSQQGSPAPRPNSNHRASVPEVPAVQHHTLTSSDPVDGVSASRRDGKQAQSV